jgi:hypothetical protein
MEHERDDDGFAVLRGAAPAEALAAYDGELDAARDRLLVRGPGEPHPALAVRRGDGPAGAIDPYALAPAARALLLGDTVVAFLADLLGTAPLLIDAAETAAGAPDPGPYRDTTYVAASDPEALTGLAVAQADGVTVAVYPGSQRLEADLFSGRYHHHNPERDGAVALEAHRERLAAALADGFTRTELTLAAGDVLVWRGALAHEAVVGRALVGHVLPAQAQPGWFAYRPQRAGRAPYGAAWLASQHYDLEEATDAAPPPAAAEAPEVEQVQEALQRHDPEPGTEPARRGGLVGTVRGLMGRRGR